MTYSIKIISLNDNILKIIINEKKSLSFVKEITKKTNLWNYEIKNNEIIINWNKKYNINFKIFNFKDNIEIFQELENNDRIYGLGEKYARLNRRYKRFHMWNVDQQLHLPLGDPTYLSIPFYIVANPKKFFGVLIDYAGYIYIDTGVKNSKGIFIKIKSNQAKFYLITGKNLKEILKYYTELTGKPFLPPKWALGYHQSRYSYMSQDEVIEVANEFRKRRIPCDAIYLDIHYMKDFMNFTWNTKNFPKPEEMIKKLKELKIKLVTIVNPGIKVSDEYEVFRKLKEIDGFIKDSKNELFLGVVWPGICAFPDFLNENVREVWSSFISEWIIQGIDGIWLDMNEPSIFLILSKDLEEKITRMLKGELNLNYIISNFTTNMINKNTGYVKINAFHNFKGNKIHHDELHNAYSLFQVISTYEGFIKARPNQRPFILSRSGFIGIQSFAALWTGDNQADWAHLEISIPQLLNLGLSFNCLFCQNWNHKILNEASLVHVDEIVNLTLKNERISCWCWFGGSAEPQLPYAINASRKILELKPSKRIVRICFEWNGDGNKGLVRIAGELAYISGGNIKFDLKAFNNSIHLALTGMDNKRVLENFELIYKEFFEKRKGIPVLGATTLLVPHYIDAEEVEEIAKFISSLSEEIPYNLLIFHPDFIMNDVPVTPKKQIEECYNVAKRYLKFVNISNMHLIGYQYSSLSWGLKETPSKISI